MCVCVAHRALVDVVAVFGTDQPLVARVLHVRPLAANADASQERANKFGETKSLHAQSPCKRDAKQSSPRMPTTSTADDTMQSAGSGGTGADVPLATLSIYKQRAGWPTMRLLVIFC